MSISIDETDSWFSRLSKLIPGELIILFQSAVQFKEKMASFSTNYLFYAWIIIALCGIFYIVIKKEIRSIVHIIVYIFSFFVISTNMQFSDFSNSLSHYIGFFVGDNYARFNIVEPVILYWGPLGSLIILLFAPKKLFS